MIDAAQYVISAEQGKSSECVCPGSRGNIYRDARRSTSKMQKSLPIKCGSRQWSLWTTFFEEADDKIRKRGNSCLIG